MTTPLSAYRACPDPATDSVWSATTDYVNINFGIYNMHGCIFVVVVIFCITIHDVLRWSHDNRFKPNSLKCKELRKKGTQGLWKGK